MRASSIFIIIISLLIAFLLTIIKLPTWIEYCRPAWIPLVICYWILALPHQIGIATAWSCGIILDILTDSILGEHALGLAITAYLILKFHRQIRVFPVWQQAFAILLLIIIYQFEIFWVQGVIGQNNIGWYILTAPVCSFIVWPLISQILKSWRLRFRIY